MSRYWISIASSNHVAIGVEGGFCQLGHGKHTPVMRLKPDDWLIYYAPRTQLKGGDKVQSFVAIGQILEGEPYQHAQTEQFTPWRRDVNYLDAETTPIRPLLHILNCIHDPQHWGMQFRRSLFEIDQHDFEIIADAMSVSEAVEPQAG
ncbi:MAG: EVE domain-containing protein [Anaerolineae bacterium]|nr:EVE domain-containing protein [Anaerolineae bacterium]